MTGDRDWWIGVMSEWDDAAEAQTEVDLRPTLEMPAWQPQALTDPSMEDPE